MCSRIESQKKVHSTKEEQLKKSMAETIQQI